MFMVNEKTTALAMYEQGQLDFVDNHSIPIFEKKRLSKQRGFKRVPQLRGYYYGFSRPAAVQRSTRAPGFHDGDGPQRFPQNLARR